MRWIAHNPVCHLERGRCGTLTHDYKRNGTSTLFAALDVATGNVAGECYQKHTHKEFLKFLKKVDAQTDKDQVQAALANTVWL